MKRLTSVVRRYPLVIGIAFLTLLAASIVSISPASLAPQAVTELVLCDGKTFDGVRGIVFDIGPDKPVNLDASVRKVIRNCTFKNITNGLPAIRIKAARNLVIEGNTFDYIRSGQPGVDTNAVSAHGCASGCVIGGLYFERNTCARIGSDCIQVGGQSTRIGNVYIRDNICTGSEFDGENCVDVKSNDPTIGPFVISGNTVKGYRPCGPKRDCSGSQGPGIVIHDGSQAQLFANGVQLIGNLFVDNTYGLNVGQGARNTRVIGNTFTRNVKAGLIASNIIGLVIDSNTFDSNPTQASIDASVRDCQIGRNTLIGKQGFVGGSQCANLPVPPTDTPTMTSTPTETPTPTASPTKTLTPTSTPRTRNMNSGVALDIGCVSGASVVIETPALGRVIVRCP